ncbi:MAG: hypothetical protein H0X17_00050 [Deltaproteobacteria bacterium]|nr:hypothetical protein [Deltaproteobacteria bacterium]
MLPRIGMTITRCPGVQTSTCGTLDTPRRQAGNAVAASARATALATRRRVLRIVVPYIERVTNVQPRSTDLVAIRVNSVTGSATDAASVASTAA